MHLCPLSFFSKDPLVIQKEPASADIITFWENYKYEDMQVDYLKEERAGELVKEEKI